MPRWPETSSENNLTLIKREWEGGRPPYLIARMLGRTWHPKDVIAVAAKQHYRRAWRRVLTEDGE